MEKTIWHELWMPDSVSRQYKNLENKKRKSPWKSKDCEFFEVIQHVENENRETQRRKGYLQGPAGVEGTVNFRRKGK